MTLEFDYTLRGFNDGHPVHVIGDWEGDTFQIAQVELVRGLQRREIPVEKFERILEADRDQEQDFYEACRREAINNHVAHAEGWE